jgi:hypothetical protein
MIIERFESFAGTDLINVALGEYGAQPGLERASTVEVTEE